MMRNNRRTNASTQHRNLCTFVVQTVNGSTGYDHDVTALSESISDSSMTDQPLSSEGFVRYDGHGKYQYVYRTGTVPYLYLAHTVRYGSGGSEILSTTWRHESYGAACTQSALSKTVYTFSFVVYKLACLIARLESFLLKKIVACTPWGWTDPISLAIPWAVLLEMEFHSRKLCLCLLPQDMLHPILRRIPLRILHKQQLRIQGAGAASRNMLPLRCNTNNSKCIHSRHPMISVLPRSHRLPTTRICHMRRGLPCCKSNSRNQSTLPHLSQEDCIHNHNKRLSIQVQRSSSNSRLPSSSSLILVECRLLNDPRQICNISHLPILLSNNSSNIHSIHSSNSSNIHSIHSSSSSSNLE
jgi:hypothetical protein